MAPGHLAVYFVLAHQALLQTDSNGHTGGKSLEQNKGGECQQNGRAKCPLFSGNEMLL